MSNRYLEKIAGGLALWSDQPPKYPGATDVAFREYPANVPSSSHKKYTNVKPLDEKTRYANAAHWTESADQLNRRGSLRRMGPKIAVGAGVLGGSAALAMYLRGKRKEDDDAKTN